MKYLVIRFLKIYQWTLSAVLGSQCRFHPSCSSYAIEAIEIHGIVKGTWLAIRRITKCHPFNSGGYDPVPRAEQAMTRE